VHLAERGCRVQYTRALVRGHLRGGHHAAQRQRRPARRLLGAPVEEDERGDAFPLRALVEGLVREADEVTAGERREDVRSGVVLQRDALQGGLDEGGGDDEALLPVPLRRRLYQRVLG